MSSIEQLNAFRKTRSEEAFCELVRLYSGFVFSVARRRLGSETLAQEVTQDVFLSLLKAPPDCATEGALASWLHRNTLNLSIDLWRKESRRKTREQAAMEMIAPSNDPETAPQWSEIAPYIDEALNQLSRADREAVLLRFFANKSMRDLGLALGVSEDAAKMRVNRAVEKLRLRLPHAATCSAAALSALLAENSIEATPGALVQQLTSLAGGAAARLPDLSPTTAFTSLLMSKAKISVAFALAISAGTAIVFLTIRAHLPGPASGPQGAQMPAPGKEATASSGTRLTVGITDRTRQSATDILAQLLDNPPYAGSYPPRELAAALAAFREQYSEALPVLLEAAGRADSETRRWAVSGINYILQLAYNERGRTSSNPDLLFAQARPVLAALLKNSDESDIVRVSALNSYVALLNGRGPGTEQDTALQDLTAVLQNSGNIRNGFAFTLIDMLDGVRDKQPVLESFRFPMVSQLATGNSDQKLVAAIVLASSPGEKPPGVKEIFLKELKERSTYSYRAARALALLGSDATDAVPLLLDYAEATAGWAGGGYAESALTSACQLQPSLLAQYPKIEAQLKAQETLRFGPPMKVVRTQNPQELAAAIAEGKASPGPETQAPNPAHALTDDEFRQKSGLLERALEAASPSHKAAVAAALQELKNLPRADDPRKPPRILAGNLLLDARVLLLESQSKQEREITDRLEKFSSIADVEINQALIMEISASIEKASPEFHKEWRAYVVKNYPYLDRLMPPLASPTAQNTR
jgi:RNA polymerase sigma factor (sigma-70 family)